MVAGVFLLVMVYGLFLLISYKGEKGFEMISPYECGFNPIGGARRMFSYRFFLISILFLIFDVEISLMMAIPFLKGEQPSMWMFSVFVSVLILGLLYEYYYGSLDWLKSMSKA